MNSLLIATVSAAVLSAATVRITCAIAQKRAWYDLPNARSSHQQPVPRLGGAAFVPIVLAVVVLGWLEGSFGSVQVVYIGSILAVFVISLLDDFRSLSAVVRFAVQFGATAAVFTALGASGLEFQLSGQDAPWELWMVMPALALWVVGVLNIYNFMDGIDGIAGLQAVAAGTTWAAIAIVSGAPHSALLAGCSAAGVLGFLTLNWPPARIFMGDAGSTVLGFIFATLPLLVLAETSSAAALPQYWLAAFLALWPFLMDGAFTILRRLRRGENIFQPHRSHLYQRLVIAGRSHRTVTLVYGALAAGGGLLACWVVTGPPSAGFLAVAAVVVAFGFLWYWVFLTEAAAASNGKKVLDRAKSNRNLVT